MGHKAVAGEDLVVKAMRKRAQKALAVLVDTHEYDPTVDPWLIDEVARALLLPPPRLAGRAGIMKGAKRG